MKQRPIFLMANPDDNYFVHQVEVFIDNNIKKGIDNETHIVLFLPSDRLERGWNPNMLKLEEKFSVYPYIKFYYYKDDGTILNRIKEINYIPLLRPYVLREHFKANEWLEKECIFYVDADILLVKPIDFEEMCSDDKCYLSYTGARYKGGNYLDLEYLEGKEKQTIKDIKPMNVISKMAEFCGITREIIEENNANTGGAQSLLKNIDWRFWDDVYNSCIKMKSFLASINQEYFEGNTPQDKENNGYQSFCTDMWSLIYNIWRRGMKVETPKVLDFAWATDPISKLEKVSIFHNAGVTNKLMQMNGETHVFHHKGAYINSNYGPTRDRDFLKMVTPDYCTSYYANALLAVDNPII